MELSSRVKDHGQCLVFQIHPLLILISDVRVESGESPSHSAGEEEDKTSRKAALVSRMAQVGTQIFPLLPDAKPVPQVQVKPPVRISFTTQKILRR